MMRTYSTECDFLDFSVDFIKETFLSKSTIVGMIVLDSVLGLSHNFLTRFQCQLVSLTVKSLIK